MAAGKGMVAATAAERDEEGFSRASGKKPWFPPSDTDIDLLASRTLRFTKFVVIYYSRHRKLLRLVNQIKI